MPTDPVAGHASPPPSLRDAYHDGVPVHAVASAAVGAEMQTSGNVTPQEAAAVASVVRAGREGAGAALDEAQLLGSGGMLAPPAVDLGSSSGCASADTCCMAAPRSLLWERGAGHQA